MLWCCFVTLSLVRVDVLAIRALVRSWECRLWDAGADLLLLLLPRVSEHPSQGAEHLCFVCSIHIAQNELWRTL